MLLSTHCLPVLCWKLKNPAMGDSESLRQEERRPAPQTLSVASLLVSQDAPPSAPTAPPRVLPRAGKRPPLISSPLGQVKNYVHAKQLPVASRPSVFQSPDEDDEEDYEQWLEIKGKVQGLLPTIRSCSSSSTGRLMVPGKARRCGLLGAVVRALPPGLQAEPRVRVRPFRMREVKEEVRSRPWGAWKGCRVRASSWELFDLLSTCVGAGLLGGVAFSGECALVHSSSSSGRGAPQCGLIVSTSLGQRCEYRGWEVPSRVQQRMVIGLR